MGGMSKEEAEMYVNTINNMFEPTGRNLFDIKEIKSRVMKDQEGFNNYMHVAIDEMDWCLEQAEKVDELISIALWSIRRLRTASLKCYALTDLKKVVGDDHKYSSFIDECLEKVKRP